MPWDKRKLDVRVGLLSSCLGSFFCTNPLIYCLAKWIKRSGRYSNSSINKCKLAQANSNKISPKCRLIVLKNVWTFICKKNFARKLTAFNKLMSKSPTPFGQLCSTNIWHMFVPSNTSRPPFLSILWCMQAQEFLWFCSLVYKKQMIYVHVVQI